MKRLVSTLTLAAVFVLGASQTFAGIVVVSKNGQTPARGQKSGIVVVSKAGIVVVSKSKAGIVVVS